jgi:hypothetical protein
MFAIIRILFHNGKKKIETNYTLNTLESMIEYTLISSIIDRICEMTKRTMKYPRDEN